MSHWDYKNADTLADAISKHVRSHPDMVEDNELLGTIQKVADEAANTVTTTSIELNRQLAVVRAICRRSGLHECNVHKGWSENCAFHFINTTEFGGL